MTGTLARDVMPSIPVGFQFPPKEGKKCLGGVTGRAFWLFRIGLISALSSTKECRRTRLRLLTTGHRREAARRNRNQGYLIGGPTRLNAPLRVVSHGALRHDVSSKPRATTQERMVITDLVVEADAANWCGWCHKLHTLFETDKSISDVLKSDYVVVMIDVNKGHNGDLYKKYADGSFGIPFLVILDADGKYLLTEHTAVLEEGDHHSPPNVIAFLKEWAPKR
jgi:hypothetical protein